MPNIRTLLWFALAAMLFFNYEAWMKDYAPAEQPLAAESNAAASSATPPGSAPTLPTTAPTLPDRTPTPAAGTPAATPSPAAEAAAAAGTTPTIPTPATIPVGASAGGGSAALVSVHTDVLDVAISLKGGELDQADLLRYPLHKDEPKVPVRLFDDGSEATLYVLQTGLEGTAGEPAPNHLATWSTPEKSYTLGAGVDELKVPLTWTDDHGLTVTKTFVFKRGSYAIDLLYDIRNDGSTPRQFASYSRLVRHWEPAKRSYFDVETYSFKGPAVWNGKKAIDLKVDNAEESKYSETITNGWLASLQHHFVAAIVPPPDEAFKYQLQVIGKQYLLSATGPTITIPPSTDKQLAEKLFVGPKLQSQLAATGPELQRTVDYGRLTVLSQPLFAVLKWVHGLIGNWGWSIIIVTALIKLIFFPLSQASGRSMAKMRAVGPRMKQIQESFKDDKEKLGRAMMELYKKEKINPLAGCLPTVIQIPFFISFYWVLLESVEMRQAPFLLWINDLSARDPYFVLPLLMGGAMFAQFKLNPAPADPMQAKIMQFMPLVMTGMMAWFPSGLVLYWLTNTVLSIAQQWYVNRMVVAEAGKKRS
jgi:YidC/Oxa1 family membrane protein insertase